MDHDERRKACSSGYFVTGSEFGNETEFDLYPSMVVEGVCNVKNLILHHGVIFELSFKWPKKLSKIDPRLTKRLSPTSLVALVPDRSQESDNQIFFATVVSRQFDNRKYPRVMLALCGPLTSEGKRAVLNLLLDRCSQTFGLIQSNSVACFNYGPVFEALQGLRHELPFAEAVAHPNGPPDAVDPPDYLLDRNKKLNLSALSTELGEIDMFSLDTVQRLTRSTSLDESQADFLINALTRKVFIGQGPPGCGSMLYTFVLKFCV